MPSTRLDMARDELTPPMMSALGSLPVRLGRDGCLPAWGPTAGTLKALERRGLAKSDGTAWVRTALGYQVWEHR